MRNGKNLSKEILVEEILKKPENMVKAIIGFLIVAFAVVTFFADFWLSPQAAQWLKEKIPSQILFLLGTIVLVELWERINFNSLLRRELCDKLKNLETEHLINIEDNLKTIKPTIRNINELINLVYIMEGGDTGTVEDKSHLAGNWISLFQNQNLQARKIEWMWEIIKISELGRLLYIETRRGRKPMRGFGKIIQKDVLLGHWLSNYGNTRKQGDFLLQLNDDNNLMYGVYNAPTSPYARFYKWIIVRHSDDQSVEDLKVLCEEGWAFLQSLEGDFFQPLDQKNTNFPNVVIDEIINSIFNQTKNEDLLNENGNK